MEDIHDRIPVILDADDVPSGFVEFENFILFVVLLTTQVTAEQNLRKLQSVTATASPGKIKMPDADASGFSTGDTQQ